MSVAFKPGRLVEALFPDVGRRIGWGELHPASKHAPTDGKPLGVLRLRNTIDISSCKLVFTSGERWDAEAVARQPSWVVVTSDVAPDI